MKRLGQAKVQDFHGAILFDLHIRRLQVAVDNALIVGRFEGLGDLLGNRESFIERDRAFGDPLSQRRPLDQLQDQRPYALSLF